MSYTWKPYEVFQLLGIPVAPNRVEQYVVCPKCGEKRMSFNMNMGVGRCFRGACEFGCDSASYYAAATGLSLNEARKDIEERLGIERGRKERPDKVQFREVIIPKESIVMEEEKASDKVLDDTYRAFLSELSLSEKNRYMLKARGLSDDEIEVLGYKTFPRKDEIDFFALCRRLQTNGHVLKGVPGFYKTSKGDYTFVQITKGIIMPCVNINNQIIGLQVRKDDDLRVFIESEGRYEGKCSWFSSKNRNGGCSANAEVHYACDFKFSQETGQYEMILPEDGVLLTEGIMKADITGYMVPNIPIISVPGVDARKQLKKNLLLLKEKGVKQVWLAYDMDYLTNSNVQEACAKTKALIEELGLTYTRMQWENSIVIKDNSGNEMKVNLNGIDDYMVYAKLNIIPKIKTN